ncbi:MAG: glutamine-hydrolyzing carbamoyl-phosphate synthase small subunit [bacterium JZ-2024 1]
MAKLWSTYKAVVMLEDGFTLEGKMVEWEGTVTGEVVFTTNMTGYVEVSTDPSYAGQIVTYTYPYIGNYGVGEELEWSKPAVRGLIIRQLTAGTLPQRGLFFDFLRQYNIPVLTEVDTRALTRHLRNTGVMKGALSTEFSGEKLLSIIRNAPGISDEDLVLSVSRKEWQTLSTGNPKVVVIDYGCKKSILNYLITTGAGVTVVPANTPAESILELQPDGVVLSNGPGDPKVISYAIDTVKNLKGKVPIFGICLGHQILALALGGDTYKLKFGHRGGNHPVKDLIREKVFITTQNHGFSVDEKSLEKTGFVVTQKSLNDDTVEGMKHREYPIISVQYHPEGSPGPLDTVYLFEEFIQSLKKDS